MAVTPWGLGAGAITSFLPMLLSNFFKGNDQYEQYRQQALGLLQPGNLMNSARDFYRQSINSPGYRLAQNQIVGAGQGVQNMVGRSLAQRGLGTSGVGSVMPGLAAGTTGMNLGQLSSSTFQNALSSALQSAQAQAGILTGGQPPLSYQNRLTAGGLNAFLPLLFSFLSKGQGGNLDMNSLMQMLSQAGPK